MASSHAWTTILLVVFFGPNIIVVVFVVVLGDELLLVAILLVLTLCVPATTSKGEVPKLNVACPLALHALASPLNLLPLGA